MNPILPVCVQICKILCETATARYAAPMTTLTPQQKLIQVSLQLQQAAVPIAQAHMAKQATLGLEHVLTEAGLSTLDGIAASLDAMNGMEALDAWHRSAWEQWMLEASRRYAEVLEDYPPDERGAESHGMMASLQREMQNQQRQRSARADWIDAARRVCVLARRGRELDPETLGIILADDDDMAEFERQVGRADAASALQQTLFEERAARIKAGMEKLQPR